MTNIAIYIYDQAEVLDFSGPFEVFSTASRICDKAEPFNVFLISQTGNTVTARAGYRVIPDFGFHNHPEVYVLIVVGGVHMNEMDNTVAIQWIAEQSQKAIIVASVCTGAFLLAKANIITDQSVTTHWEDIADLRTSFPQLNVVENVRWVDEGDVVTSAGITAGIDMSLHLVGRLHSTDLAEKTARKMDFVWTRNS